jgi:hypothetical protein
MRLLLAALCLAFSTHAHALTAEKAPATMETVKQGWQLLEWGDAKQARQWFKTASQSEDDVTAYYGWEGIADSDVALEESPATVFNAYARAHEHGSDKVLDSGLAKRWRDRVIAYQKKLVEEGAPGHKWQGQEGRRALQAIGEGKYDAEPQLRLAAFETLGDRAWAGHHSMTAAQAAVAGWRMALNQDPDLVQRERLEQKLRQGEKLLPGYKASDDDAAYDQGGLVADPALLALMSRCGQCGGQGGKQRRACAEVAQAYTNFYGPGARHPEASIVRAKVQKLEGALTNAGCL